MAPHYIPGYHKNKMASSCVEICMFTNHHDKSSTDTTVSTLKSPVPVVQCLPAVAYMHWAPN